MLEEAYHVEATAALTLLGRLWFEKISHQLWNYAESLNDWLHELSKHPSPDWRERLDAFITEQEAAGFILSPESHADLVAYLEKWSSTEFKASWVEERVIESSVERTAQPEVVPPSAAKEPSLLPPRRLARQAVPDRKPSWWRPHSRERAEFHSYLTNARGCIYDLEPLLEALANRIEAARPDEPCDVDAELNAIDYLIWRHNDLMESARGVWLSGNLGSEELTQLDLELTPASLGLPLFTDEEQADRAKAQSKKIGERLKQEIAFLGKVIFALEAIETAGEIASLVLAGGILIAAAKRGGKVVLVKTVGKMVASAAAASVVGEVTNTALNAVGVEDETIEKVQNAVELVSWLLFLRKARLLGKHARSNARPKVADDARMVDSGTRPKALTPYRDPEPPDYNSGATHIDHAHARSLGGGDVPSNLRPLPAESNLRKGGYEGELKRYKDMLIRSGMSEKDAQAVIQPEIDALKRSVVARPVDPSVLDSLPFNPNDQGR